MEKFSIESLIGKDNNSLKKSILLNENFKYSIDTLLKPNNNHENVHRHIAQDIENVSKFSTKPLCYNKFIDRAISLDDFNPSKHDSQLSSTFPCYSTIKKKENRSILTNSLNVSFDENTSTAINLTSTLNSLYVVKNINSRKKRQSYTNDQLITLEEQFKIDPYPHISTFEELSRKMNIEVKKIQIWFQNHRARLKKINN
uniref:Homeobox protein ANF1-like n=1 Tax=Tetracapsuloides bryosalmonae TaxID=271932 RepID=A0A859IQE9_9CNID|nr:homeobox protein ANF1-like [Tetracapsuloides bryosalmonae]